MAGIAGDELQSSRFGSRTWHGDESSRYLQSLSNAE
jgi:hypothetical protein